MKIAIIAAGAGGMYCGSCIRDNALASVLMERGHEVVLMPIYTPMRTDEAGVAIDHVFYGAVSIFLEQKIPGFARIPRWLRGWLDHPALLRHIPMSSSATNAKQLGELTLSTLRGEEGRQKAEVEHLCRWLAEQFDPDVVQLSNSMLLGFVRELKQFLPRARIVCALQGEDIFLDDLEEPWRARVIELMRERARDCDLFVATSQFYVEPMAELLAIEPHRIEPTRVGIRLPIDDVCESSGGLDAADAAESAVPFTIGFLARICPEKGLHVLVEAFEQLAGRHDPAGLRLRVAGYLGGRDRAYADALRRRIEDAGLADSVDWVGEVDLDAKHEFLRSLDLFSVPTTYHEPKGLPVLEAMAHGVPVVQPNHGAFPELLEDTGGGVLVPPEDPVALAAEIERLMRAPEERRELARLGAAGVRARHSLDAMADDTLRAYERVVARDGGSRTAADSGTRHA